MTTNCEASRYTIFQTFCFVFPLAVRKYNPNLQHRWYQKPPPAMNFSQLNSLQIFVTRSSNTHLIIFPSTSPSPRGLPTKILQTFLVYLSYHHSVHHSLLQFTSLMPTVDDLHKSRNNVTCS